MSVEDWSLPSLFPEDYPDERSPEQRARDQAEVCHQVADLVRRRRDGAFRRELLSLLKERRYRRDDLAQFEVIPSRRGFETLVVTGELLVREEALRHEAVRKLLSSRYGFRESPVECLDGRVRRLRQHERERRTERLDATRLDDVARLLRREGVSASVNHITPLGPIAKGLGGPEPSAGLPPFRASAETRKSTPIKVALVDTGIADRVRDDGWLASVPRIEPRRPRDPDMNIDLLNVLPDDHDPYLDFGAGHGTFAAGVVQQVAHRAEIAMYRALDTDGIGSEVDVACRMVQAVREGAHILNLSLGTQTLEDQPPVAIEVALEIIGDIERREGREVVVVAAAGNYASTRPCWPAAFRRVVSVAGLEPDGRPSEWSSRGFWVDCSTIAEGVRSTYVEGEESPDIDPSPDNFGRDPWAVWTGTSFAAPQIAGAIARLAYERGLTPGHALHELLRAGRRIADFGRAVKLLPGT
jgi:hypothetical protein